MIAADESKCTAQLPRLVASALLLPSAEELEPRPVDPNEEFWGCGLRA